MSEILIVDDSELIRSELEAALKDQGYSLSIAEDGFEGLNALKDDSSLKLVITDFNMPNMNGIEMIENLRENQGNTAIKVIVMSTETNTLMRKKCKDLAVSGWVLKPLNVPALLPVIKKLVST